MQVVLRSLAVLVIALALTPMALAAPQAAQPEAVNTGDELVIITSDGRLEARDPYVPTGFQPVVWSSPTAGFTDVATGDFNGDGTDEVVGLRGGEAVVYDPVRGAGEPDVSRTFNATAGQFWRNVTTGDLDGDGRDELVLAESSGSGTQMFAFKFVGNTWNQTFSAFYGAPFVGLTTGNVIGSSAGMRQQVVAIRNAGSNCQIIIFNPANNWQTLNEFTRNFPWTYVTVGDVTLDGAGKEEIVVTRTGVGATLPSMFVFRWEQQFPELQDQEREVFNPEFRWVALADVNASGDKEVFLLRNNMDASQVALTSRNYGNDQGTPVFNELVGQTQWNFIQAGDIDADGRDEVIVMSPNQYLIYTQPDVSTASTAYAGSFWRGGNFAVGDLDGQGQVAGPTLSVSPLSVDLNLQAGQNFSQPIAITNTGSGTLNWSATVVDGSAWLSLSPSNGTAPTTAQLMVSTGGVAPGSYVGRVRIDAPGANSTPQTITVNLVVTAPQFAVQPSQVSWIYTPPTNPGVRTVTVSGQNVPWHAGLVDTSLANRVEQAVAAGQSVTLQDGQLVIGDGRDADGVPPAVTWISINPLSGVATPGGILVDLSLVLDQVPSGFRTAAVVFVADTTASPPALVVRASTLRTQPNASDLYFLPLILR
ncbi:MAG: VCBS repeat-containing protein [Anaerolinea sp.]|nr:VCBS repeat-containing protein [Anaerolinea sp.]